MKKILLIGLLLVLVGCSNNSKLVTTVCTDDKQVSEIAQADKEGNISIFTIEWRLDTGISEEQLTNMVESFDEEYIASEVSTRQDIYGNLEINLEFKQEKEILIMKEIFAYTEEYNPELAEVKLPLTISEFVESRELMGFTCK